AKELAYLKHLVLELVMELVNEPAKR
ncbi:MAG: hypothetical protein RL733_1350, partial [Actinomycetota bacterium]